MPVPARRLASGMIWVDVVPRGDGGRAVVYARVSSHDQRAGLDRQVARLTESVTVIVVEHHDRLARFGTEQLDAALAAAGRRILVADRGETSDDLVRYMIEVLTSMCARLYGRRGARNRAMRAVAAVKNAGVDEAA